MAEKTYKGNNVSNLKLGEPEPGIRFDGKLVRDMSDADVKQYAKQAWDEYMQAELMMRDAVMRHATLMSIANVLAFEEERRVKKIRLPGELI